MLIIFDKDGTLVKDVDGKRPPNSISEQEPYPDVLPTCRQLNEEGHILAVASNQGGVAYGFISATTAHHLVKDIADFIQADDYVVCVCHPQGSKPWAARESAFRKPNPGMIQYLMDAWGFTPDQTLYVGDMETDRQAAEAAGCQFKWAWAFFEREEP